MEITLNLKKPLPVFQLEHAFAIDLWAFGCLLYFILEGVSPFHDRSDELALRRIIQYVKRDEKICLEYFERTRSLEGGGDRHGYEYDEQQKLVNVRGWKQVFARPCESSTDCRLTKTTGDGQS